MTSKIYDENAGSILESLAKILNVDIEEHLNQCKLQIPEDYGTGEVRLFSFSHGISTISIDLELKRSLELIYNDGAVHPLKMILIKNGVISHAFHQGEKVDTVNEFESLIIASTPEKTHTFKIPRNKKITFLSIQINRKKFEPKIEDFIPHMHKDLSRIFRDVNGIQEFHYKNFYTPESLKLIEAILTNQDTDVIETVKLEGLTYQLITLQLKHYLVNLKSPNPIATLATKTRKKIAKAVELIENDISNYNSVKNLAQQLNINEKTLQAGFKQFYNCTVNTYVRNFRAHQARMYVETTDLSVSEIAYKLGLNSPSHLSKLFKLYYGRSPSEHKRQTKNVKGL